MGPRKDPSIVLFLRDPNANGSLESRRVTEVIQVPRQAALLNLWNVLGTPMVEQRVEKEVPAEIKGVTIRKGDDSNSTVTSSDGKSFRIAARREITSQLSGLYGQISFFYDRLLQMSDEMTNLFPLQEKPATKFYGMMKGALLGNKAMDPEGMDEMTCMLIIAGECKQFCVWLIETLTQALANAPQEFADRRRALEDRGARVFQQEKNQNDTWNMDEWWKLTQDIVTLAKDIRTVSTATARDDDTWRTIG